MMKILIKNIGKKWAGSKKWNLLKKCDRLWQGTVLAREYDLSRRVDMSTDIRLASDAQITPNNEFIRLVENKGFSIFHLITEEEYEKGLALLKIDNEKK